jgi:hypothetical protein
MFVRRYEARALGPRLFFRDDIPDSELEPIEPGSQLPGGIVALSDGRGRCETPLSLPEQRAWVSPTRSLRLEASCWFGLRRGTWNERCRHCAHCLNFRLTT